MVIDSRNLTSALENVRLAAAKLAGLSDERRAELVRSVGAAVEARAPAILAANAEDLSAFDEADIKRDRLLLNEASLSAMVKSVNQIADYDDPTGKVLYEHVISPERAGSRALNVQKVTVPMGVLGMIYESRPNVTLDASVLALRSGNAIVLRGGSEAYRTNQAIVKAVNEVLDKHNLNPAAVTLLPTDRALVKLLLTAEGLVDMIIPRGSEELIRMVRREATVPVIETGAGVCHTYVAASADPEKAAEIILNAKLQRPTVCNALDTIIVDEQIAGTVLPKLVDKFGAHKVEIWADEPAWQILHEQGYRSLKRAHEADYGREFLGYGCSVKTVAGIDEALEHVRRYSSGHSEVIISQDGELCERFLRQVDAATVLSNASSRFTDGELFGLGAEIGISTQKLHARGPFGLDKLVCEKWLVRGDGHVRQ